MLDADLAELYAVETKQLVRAVKRNIDRFPARFCVSAYGERVYGLEVPNWHLKFVGRSADTAVGLYGTGRGDALQRAAQQTGGAR